MEFFGLIALAFAGSAFAQAMNNKKKNEQLEKRIERLERNI